MPTTSEFTPSFFDEASKAWRLNKISLEEGSFRYKRNAFSPLPLPSVKKEIIPLRRSPRLLESSRSK